MMAAIRASASAPVTLFTDGALGRSNTAMAQGGLQLPEPEPDALAAFVDDMLVSARIEIDRGRVEAFVARVGDTVAELEAWGLTLDRTPSGEILRKRAGGLSRPRVVSVGDTIGPALVRVLRQRVLACPIEVRNHTRVVQVEPCAGGIRVTTEAGASHDFAAVVCCTGGLGYDRSLRTAEPTTNPENDNARLYRALCTLGLERVHEDLYQYHPFAIVEPWLEPPTPCVPETIVNHPVALLDRHGRTVCPLGVDRLTLVEASLAATARGDAFVTAQGRHGFALTLSRVDSEVLRVEFAKLHRLLERTGRLGADVLVAPALHYYLGGFVAGHDGATSIPGLFLAGEMVGGLHGRNRLMGNGLTDSLVHGRAAGSSAAAWAAR